MALPSYHRRRQHASDWTTDRNECAVRAKRGEKWNAYDDNQSRWLIFLRFFFRHAATMHDDRRLTHHIVLRSPYYNVVTASLFDRLTLGDENFMISLRYKGHTHTHHQPHNPRQLSFTYDRKSSPFLLRHLVLLFLFSFAGARFMSDTQYDDKIIIIWVWPHQYE